jgi:hypothetical protein
VLYEQHFVFREKLFDEDKMTSVLSQLPKRRLAGLTRSYTPGTARISRKVTTRVMGSCGHSVKPMAR